MSANKTFTLFSANSRHQPTFKQSDIVYAMAANTISPVPTASTHDVVVHLPSGKPMYYYSQIEYFYSNNILPGVQFVIDNDSPQLSTSVPTEKEDQVAPLEGQQPLPPPETTSTPSPGVSGGQVGLYGFFENALDRIVTPRMKNILSFGPRQPEVGQQPQPQPQDNSYSLPSLPTLDSLFPAQQKQPPPQFQSPQGIAPTSQPLRQPQLSQANPLQPDPIVQDTELSYSPQFIDADVASDSEYENSDADDSEYDNQDSDTDDNATGEAADDNFVERDKIIQSIPDNSALIQSKFKGTKLDYFYRKNKVVWV